MRYVRVSIATSILLGFATSCTKPDPNEVVFGGGKCGGQDLRTYTARFMADKNAGTVLVQLSNSDRPGETATSAYKGCVIYDEANWQCETQDEASCGVGPDIESVRLGEN